MDDFTVNKVKVFELFFSRRYLLFYSWYFSSFGTIKINSVPARIAAANRFLREETKFYELGRRRSIFVKIDVERFKMFYKIMNSDLRNPGVKSTIADYARGKISLIDAYAIISLKKILSHQ